MTVNDGPFGVTALLFHWSTLRWGLLLELLFDWGIIGRTLWQCASRRSRSSRTFGNLRRLIRKRPKPAFRSIHYNASRFAEIATIELVVCVCLSTSRCV